MAGFTTRILHSDRRSPIEQGSIHKPIHATVAYGYEKTADLAGAFQGTVKGYTYGRQVNPTLTALEIKLTDMEGGLESVVFSTGMAAIGTMLFALLREGDHFISSSFLFGNTNSLFESFAAHGIEVSFVDATAAERVEEAIQDNTRIVFVETIANPRTQVSDLNRIGELCRRRNLLYVVDNTMTSPYLYQPITSQAGLIVNSLTKYIGGHANALGGVITETGLFDWTSFANIYDTYRKGDTKKWGITQIRKKGLRDFGAALDPATANRIAIGAETLALRMEKQCHNTQALVDLLVEHPKISKVYFPGLSEHPEYALTQSIFRYPGALFSFELLDTIDAFEFLDNLKIVIKSSNLGDNRTLAIPVAHTIYHEMGPKRRASMGIKDSLVRISAGIEDTDDLVDDFRQALEAV